MDNSISLSGLLARDFLSANIASIFVSPFINIIDKSIIRNANGSVPLEQGVKIGFKEWVTTPRMFYTRYEFGLIKLVYTMTYTSANMTDTICNSYGISPVIPKLFTTTLANMTTSIFKDREYTRMFGVIAKSPFPPQSYAMFFMRDIITMGFCFSLPNIVAKEVEKKFQMDFSKAQIIAQLSLPCLIQFVTTPIHLFGLDFYNNKNASLGDRATRILKLLPKTIVARWCRVFPAFGIGGVGNTKMRNYLKQTKF